MAQAAAASKGLVQRYLQTAALKVVVQKYVDLQAAPPVPANWKQLARPASRFELAAVWSAAQSHQKYFFHSHRQVPVFLVRYSEMETWKNFPEYIYREYPE